MRPLIALPLLPLFATSGLAQSTVHDVTGSAAESFGQVCDTIGDTDGDGYAEFLVGAWRHDPSGIFDAGAVFVYDGATGALTDTIPGTGVGDHMGYGSSGAGDINGDGFADICAAADEDDTAAGSNAGSAILVSGFDGSTIWTLEGEDAGDLFGWSTAAVGDVDGDGRDDVLIGALNAEGGASPNNAGSITAFSGQTGLPIHTIYGSVANGNLGSNVGRAGDVNADGHADLIAAQGNLARVFSGLDASVLWEFNVAGGGFSGVRVSGGFDANGDGHADLIVGAPSFTASTGQAVVFSGADGSTLHSLTGSTTGEQFGSNVAGAGDVNGDGYGDFVVGITSLDDGGTNAGGLRAYSGFDGTEIFTVFGSANNDRIGAAVGAGHDVNLDGFPDAIGSATSGKAKVASFTPLGLTPFGTGTPCAETQPLLANAVPIVGDAGFALLSSEAPPLLPGVVVLGDTADVAGTPLLGALLHVALPPTGSFALFLGTPAADANGSLTIPLPIPATPTLIGATVAAQLGTAWASGPCAGSFTSSRGLELVLQ